MTVGRLPLDSSRPMVVCAAMRLVLVVAALAMTLALDFPFGDELALVLAVLALPWAIAYLLFARLVSAVGMSPLMAFGDIVVLVGVALAVPEAYGVVRFLALFVIAAHAHFQGERWGVLIAVAASAALISVAAFDDPPVSGDLLVLYEALFALCALAAAAVVGRLRTAESAARLRAEELTRRSFGSENDVRRRIAESIHDGPVQELVSLDMMLAAAARTQDRDEAARIIRQARDVAVRNVTTLRDEIVGLGPYAFEELSFEGALDQCMPVWRRRYDFRIDVEVEPLELSPEVEESLFRITQEAVVNAGRHSGASNVRLSLRGKGEQAELRVVDDGHGFEGADPLSPTDPGHIGLASIRQRAEVVSGKLEIETGAEGTEIRVSVPRNPPRGSAEG